MVVLLASEMSVAKVIDCDKNRLTARGCLSYRQLSDCHFAADPFLLEDTEAGFDGGRLVHLVLAWSTDLKQEIAFRF